MSGYTGGRIKRIKIHNFMTYDDIEILPESGLNLIVGLNGSGKSSIMCAICLGLAGKPQFTGRASSLSDFIKHGQQSAEIEIELECVDDMNVVITRKLKGDKGEWYLNRSPSNLQEVTDAVKQFNIDTSNLCQFLPQEKVVEFSRMTKIQRLENMLQAIGEPHLFVLYNELKELFKKCFEVENNIKRFQQNKSTYEEKNDRISDEVKKQEERVRLRKELDDLLKIKTIIEYKEIQTQVKAMKREKKGFEIELRNFSQKKEEALSVENSILSKYKKQAEKYHRSKSETEEISRKLNYNSNTIAKLNEKAHDAKIEYNNKLAEKETQMQRLQDLNSQIAGLEKAIQEGLQKKESYDEKLQENSSSLLLLQQEISELYQKIENVSEEKNAVTYQITIKKNQILALRDEHKKGLNTLKRVDKSAYDAVLWLQDNKDRFKSAVFLPIMLEVKVNSNEHCKYVESHIPLRDMIAFVCEDKEDCKRLTDILKNQRKLPVNIVMAPDTPLSRFRSPPIPPEFRNWGLEGFLVDLMTAPEPVMRYLCQVYGVHGIPVATSNVDESKIEKILQKFKLFFANNVKVSGKKSRYGDHNWSVRRDFISSRNLLSNTDDEALRTHELSLQSLEAQLNPLNQKYEELRHVLAEKERIQEKLRQERKLLQDSQKQIKNLYSNLQMKKIYRTKISVMIDEEEEKAKLSRIIQNVIESKVKVFHESRNMLKGLYNLQKESVRQMLRMNSLSKELKMTRAANEEILDQVKDLEQKIMQLQKVIDEKTGPAQQLYKEISKINIKVSQTLLECSVEDMEGKISHVQAQLNLNEDNEPLIKEFNARKRQIDAITTDINQLQDSLDNLRDEMETKKQEWLNPLEYHITNINKKFSRYFKYLCCAGEIALDIPENPNDFAKYGLQIKLKFHDDQPLKELSIAHHSGGERSVAAIIFILSLQELTEVPFRCIDEINQGMDSIYERKIYSLIADSVGDEKCSQYFLLTPKLLMDLSLPDNAKVHIIYNSCFLKTKIDIQKSLRNVESS